MIYMKQGFAFKAFKEMSVTPDIYVLWGYLLACPRGGHPDSKDQFPY